MTTGESLVLGLVIGARGDARRPVRVGGQARPRRQGLRAAARRATAACSTGSTRCSGPARLRTSRCSPSPDLNSSFTGAQASLRRETRRDPRCDRIDRPAGDRGRRRATPSSSCARSSRARRRWTSSPPSTASSTSRSAAIRVQLLERSEPDVVLNAVVGFAGVRATLWALEQGVTLALANKESLVAAGELALAAQRAGGRPAPPGRQRALGAPPVPRGTRPASRRRDRPDRVRRAVPRPHARRSSTDVDRGGGARPPDVAHGPEDHDRLGDAREQGARADRGALAVRRAVRRDRGRRAPVVDRPLARPLPRRRAARARGLAGHAGPDLVRVDLPRRAPRRRSRSSARGARRWRSRRSTTSFPLLGLARAAGERGGTAPCAYNAANEVAVAAFLEGRHRASSTSPTVVEETLARVDGAPARDLDDLVAADEEARRLAARGLQPA